MLTRFIFLDQCRTINSVTTAGFFIVYLFHGVGCDVPALPLKLVENGPLLVKSSFSL
jgi:hypothetical protein